MEDFKASDFYKIYVSSFINLCFSVFGNTVGIWASYIIISILLDKLFDNLQWPGLETFIQDGSILLISFSFFTSALYVSTRRLKITFLNCTCGLALIINLGFYLRVIALKNKFGGILYKDGTISTSSTIIFFTSILLLYIILAIEKYVENNSDAEKSRNASFEKLKGKFNAKK